MTIKIGDVVRDKYTGFNGIVVNIWNGKYNTPYYSGEMFNSYRITVRFGTDYIKRFGSGLCENGTILKQLEHLEKV